jgi:hypothetical protein
MLHCRCSARAAIAAVLAALVTTGVLAAPQETPASVTARKSVYGKLNAVDRRLSVVAMMSDGGERLAWRFDAKVIAEIEKVKLGEPMIVIYRQVTPNEKHVTAVAFPGTADTPIYLNLTGERIVLRSAPAVDGTCGGPDASAVQESTISSGGMVEATDACWCCAAAGETCTPGTKTGNGRALLVRCFE